jgi:tellurium resistance protein TerD
MEKLKLTKGGSINLSKRYSGETKYRVGLAWDISGSGRDADLDALILEVCPDGRILDIDHVVGFPSGDPDRENYRNITFSTPDGGTGFKDPEDAVKHFGDARTALASDGDDESIEIDLAKVNPKVSELILIVSIYNPGMTFKDVGAPEISIYKGSSQVSDLSYQLSESFPEYSVIEVAKIKKDAGTWTLEALGNGSVDLEAELKKYHIPV